MRYLQFLIPFGLGALVAFHALTVEFRSGLEAWGLAVLLALIVVCFVEIGPGGAAR